MDPLNSDSVSVKLIPLNSDPGLNQVINLYGYTRDQTGHIRRNIPIAITINITYSDASSGIDLNSLVVYHNNTDITSTLNKQANSATGSVTGTTGGNVINGHMTAGFALVACPSEHGISGVMTFIISHQGKLYQKDLGPKTTDIVGGMKEYNPDSGWTLVAP